MSETSRKVHSTVTMIIFYSPTTEAKKIVLRSSRINFALSLAIYVAFVIMFYSFKCSTKISCFVFELYDPVNAF